MKHPLCILAFLLLTISLFGQDNSLSIILPEAAADIHDTISGKDYKGFFALQNTSSDTLHLRRARITEFADGGNSHPVKAKLSFDGKKLDSIAIPGGQLVQVGIEGNFKFTGNYLAIFTAELLSGGKSSILTKKIRVVRRNMPGKVPQRFFQLDKIVKASGNLGDHQLRVLVRDTLGQGGKLLPPSVTLQRKLNETELGQADYAYLQVRDTSGKVLDTLTFAPFEAKTIVLHIGALNTPGTYRGDFWLTSSEGPKAGEAFVVTTRRTWCAALGWITLGLLLSLVLRRLIQEVQPRIKRQNKVAVLIEQVEALQEQVGIRPYETAVLGALHVQLSNLYGVLRRQAPTDLDARLGIFTQKIGLYRCWRVARRAVDALEPAELRLPLRGDLEAARDFIEGDGGTAEKAGELETSLRTIDQRIRTALATHIDQEVATLLQSASGGFLEANAEELPIIRQKAENASAATASTDAEMRAKLAAYDELRRYFIEIMEAHMRDNFSTPQLGISQQVWDRGMQPSRDILDSLKRLTGTEEKMETLVLAYKQSSIAVADMSLNRIGELEKTHNNLTPEARAALEKGKKELIEARKKLENISVPALSSDRPTFPDLPKVLESAVFSTREATDVPRSGPFTTQGETQSETLLRQSDLFLTNVSFQAVESPDAASSRETVDLNRLRRQAFQAEMLSSGLVLVVTALLGLLILWSGNETWGSVEDVLYAILWGFGLHTVSKTTEMENGAFNFVSGRIK